MTVGPAHGVLNGDVEVVKGVGRGDLDAAPDERVNSEERDPELFNARLFKRKLGLINQDSPGSWKNQRKGRSSYWKNSANSPLTK